MIYAIVMAGGRGTRLKVNVEKPLFKLHGKPLIKYVLDNISSSKLVEDVVIAVSPHTQETIKYLKSLNGNFQILNTSGIDYLNDLSYIFSRMLCCIHCWCNLWYRWWSDHQTGT